MYSKNWFFEWLTIKMFTKRSQEGLKKLSVEKWRIVNDWAEINSKSKMNGYGIGVTLSTNWVHFSQRIKILYRIYGIKANKCSQKTTNHHLIWNVRLSGSDAWFL